MSDLAGHVFPWNGSGRGRTQAQRVRVGPGLVRRGAGVRAVQGPGSSYWRAPLRTGCGTGSCTRLPPPLAVGRFAPDGGSNVD